MLPAKCHTEPTEFSLWGSLLLSFFERCSCLGIRLDDALASFGDRTVAWRAGDQQCSDDERSSDRQCADRRTLLVCIGVCLQAREGIASA